MSGVVWEAAFVASLTFTIDINRLLLYFNDLRYDDPTKVLLLQLTEQAAWFYHLRRFEIVQGL